MFIDPQALIVRSSVPVETTVGNEIVLMTLDSGECIGLGTTGSDTWRLLSQPIPFQTLIATLRQTYQAPPGVIEQDVAELLEDMQRRNLVELRSPEPAVL